MAYFPDKEKIAVCKINNASELYIFPKTGTLCIDVVSRLQAAIGNKTGGFIEAHTEKSRSSSTIYLNPKAITSFTVETIEVPEEIKTKIKKYNDVQKINAEEISQEEIKTREELRGELNLYFNS